MFNGIIYHCGIVKKIFKQKKSLYLEIKTNLKFKNKEIGSSISCNGVCLTLTKILKGNISFYLSFETLNKSNFKMIKPGDIINLEKSVTYGQKISGHYLQGHIDCTGYVSALKIIENTWMLSIKIHKKYKKLLVNKASIGINGVSLTISKILANGFQVSIIPHSLKLTNLKDIKISDKVNIEIDFFSKYFKKINK